MDVVWSERHHLVACCAMDENALPLLAFVGGEENASKVPQEKATWGGEDGRAKSDWPSDWKQKLVANVG